VFVFLGFCFGVLGFCPDAVVLVVFFFFFFFFPVQRLMVVGSPIAYREGRVEALASSRTIVLVLIASTNSIFFLSF
jgi:hypothetical protein